MTLLSVKELSVSFRVPGGQVDAVKGVSFDIEKGETLALVGESGSGKSVSALSVLQLLPYPTASHPSGSITFDGTEMVGADAQTLFEVRGNKVSMIFQEPLTSLNPLHNIERQIGEVLELHQGQFPAGKSHYFIHADKLAAGAYLLRLQTEAGLQSQRIVVK